MKVILLLAAFSQAVLFAAKPVGEFDTAIRPHLPPEPAGICNTPVADATSTPLQYSVRRNTWLSCETPGANARLPNFPSISITDKPFNADPTGSAPINSALVGAMQAGLLITAPQGEYLIDNTNGPVVITGFNGLFRTSASAHFVCLNPDALCLQFSSGSPSVDGLNLTYLTMPTVRHDQPALLFYQTRQSVLTNAVITGAPGPGVVFQECISPLARLVTITQTMADGLDFFTCENALALDITTDQTGDDGLAFVNYIASPDRNGGAAANIHVSRSNARGISVVGTSNVVISNFVIDQTTSAGVICFTDFPFSTRVPYNVQFTQGTINRAGTYLLDQQRGNPFGIEWSLTGSGMCNFDHLKVSNTGNRGVSGQGGEIIVLSDIVVDHSGSDGMNIGSADLRIANLTVQHSQGYGYYLNGYRSPVNTRLSGTNLTSYDNGLGLQGDQAGRAFGIEQNAVLQLSNLTMIDDQPQPTSFKLEETNNGLGTIIGIRTLITNGMPVITNNSPGVQVVVTPPSSPQ